MKAPPVSDLPIGTVTFFFTDIEASTRLLQHLGDAAAAQVFDDHRRLLRAAFESGGGRELQDQGDGFLVVFQSAHDAVHSAVAAQRDLDTHPWPTGASLRVRIGLHTGEPTSAAGGYVGLDVHRAARICSAGHGGQILMSETTRSLVEHDLPPGVSLRDLGAHRLKDLTRPEHVFQLVVPGLPADFPPLKSLDALPNNLPVQLTSFIGREREIGQIKNLLATARLLTLTGSGGAGKTRLAFQAAAELLGDFTDGVWLVELGSLTDPTLVPQRVASTLGVHEEPGRPLIETVSAFLYPKSLLLLLDNCEHLLPVCAQLAHTLLRKCPHLRILTTSREALGMEGELAYRVPSLSLPDPQHLPSLDGLTQYEAVRLFIDRAFLSDPRFVVTSSNAAPVAQVCHHLDGIPLAIELAAARVRVMSAEQIAARLDDRFRLLRGGSRTAPPRHQTLRAAIDWSYDLLSEKEKVLLRRLSVFAGGWTLEAAEAVCAGGGVEAIDTVDLLTQLADKSLVSVETQDKESRFRLLETVRQYSKDRLLESGEGSEVRWRHREWCLGLVEKAERELHGPGQQVWLGQLEIEHDNLRAAMAWSKTQEDGAELGLRLAMGLWWFWSVRGYWSEGRQWLEGMLAANDSSPAATRTTAFNRAAVLAFRQGDYQGAKALYEESLALSRKLAHRHGIASSLHNLGLIAMHQAEYEQATPVLEESLTLFRELGDQQGIAASIHQLGFVAMHQGDYDRATALLEESLSLFRGLKNIVETAASLSNLGVVARYKGDHGRAEALLHESLALSREIGDKGAIASALRNLGAVAWHEGEYGRATALLDESLVLCRELGDKGGIAAALQNLGFIALHQGDYARAAALIDESLVLSRELGDNVGIAASLSMQAMVARYQGNAERAATLYRESLALRWKLGEKRGIAECLEGLAEVARAQRQAERAARLFGAAEALREAIGAPLPPDDRARYGRQPAVWSGMDEGEVAAASARGRAMTLEQAIGYALRVEAS